jgi:outer membrane protein assembly factor BamC
MTRKAHLRTATSTVALTALAFSLTACTTVFESDKVDYKTATKAPTLEVPPDLTQLQKDNRYAVPEGRGVATASGYQQQRDAGGPSGVPAASGEAIGPVATDAVRIERAGTVRWLVVKQTPEQLWPQLEQFWRDSGFVVETANAQTAIMETNWAENRAKIPQDIIRRTLGRVFDSAYSTNTKDKYRTRLERRPDGSTEIYITERSVEEMPTGPQKETSVWVTRPADPELEAEFLSRLMVRLTGAKLNDARTAVASASADASANTAANANANAPVASQHAALQGNKVVVDEGFDRAWRRVGLALDRAGFTVEDRDRVQGIYFVRYVDPDSIKEEGFFTKLFSTADKFKQAQRYRVIVASSQGATSSDVTVTTDDGKPDTTPVAAKILNVLSAELK